MPLLDSHRYPLSKHSEQTTLSWQSGHSLWLPLQAVCAGSDPPTLTYPSGLTVRLPLGPSELLTSFRLFLVCLTFGLLLCLLFLTLSCSTPLSEEDSEEEEELQEESESSECVGFFLFFSNTFNRY